MKYQYQKSCSQLQAVKSAFLACLSQALAVSRRRRIYDRLSTFTGFLAGRYSSLGWGIGSVNCLVSISKQTPPLFLQSPLAYRIGGASCLWIGLIGGSLLVWGRQLESSSSYGRSGSSSSELEQSLICSGGWFEVRELKVTMFSRWEQELERQSDCRTVGCLWTGGCNCYCGSIPLSLQ